MVTCETESKWCNNILEDRGATYRWPILIKVRQIETLGAWTWITFVHWSHMFWTSGCWFDVKQRKDKTWLDKKTRFKLPSLSITASRIHLEKYLTWCVLEQKHLNPPRLSCANCTAYACDCNCSGSSQVFKNSTSHSAKAFIWRKRLRNAYLPIK